MLGKICNRMIYSTNEIGLQYREINKYESN